MRCEARTQTLPRMQLFCIRVYLTIFGCIWTAPGQAVFRVYLRVYLDISKPCCPFGQHTRETPPQTLWLRFPRNPPTTGFPRNPGQPSHLRFPSTKLETGLRGWSVRNKCGAVTSQRRQDDGSSLASDTAEETLCQEVSLPKGRTD